MSWIHLNFSDHISHTSRMGYVTLAKDSFLITNTGSFFGFFEERLPKKNFINKLPINSVAFKAKVVTQQKFPKIF